VARTVAHFLLPRPRDRRVRQVFGHPADGIDGLLAAWGRPGNDPQFVQAGITQGIKQQVQEYLHGTKDGD
jgi:hypothetical protein